MTWDDELSIEVSVTSIGEHSFSFLVKGFVGQNTVAFIANITHVCISPESKKVVTVPGKLRALLQN